jgi:hypothetical protein
MAGRSRSDSFAALPVPPGSVDPSIRNHAVAHDSARDLFRSLATARRLGVNFDEAGALATIEALGQACDPGDWAPVLDSTRDAWESAHVGEPAGRHGRAFSLLAWDTELVDVDRRLCRLCGQPIPSGRRRAAVFCGAGCQRAWHRRRVAA